MFHPSKLPIISFLLLFSSLTALAQAGTWLDTVKVYGGSNFKKLISDDKFSNTNGELEARSIYKSERFNFSGKLNGGYLYSETNKMGVSLEVKSPQDGDFKFSIDDAAGLSKNWYLSLDLDASYKISEDDLLKLGFKGKYKRDFPEKFVVSINLQSIGATLASGSDENSDNLFQQYGLNGKYEHKFGTSGRLLTFDFNADVARDSKYTEWTIGKYDLMTSTASTDRIYRLTPLNIDFKTEIKAGYKAVSFCGVDGLDTEFRLKATVKTDNDFFSAANKKGKVWVDSTNYAEHFNYLSCILSPGFNVKFTRKYFALGVDFWLETFSHRLSGEREKGHLSTSSVSPVGKATAAWTPDSRNMLELSFNRSVRRPEYINMCWFTRPGAFATEIIQGNPYLLPASSNKAALAYGYTQGRFSGKAEISSNYEKNKIERVFRNESIGGNNYTVYSWANAGRSYTSAALLQLKWSGKRLKADLEGKYNYFDGESGMGVITRESDYSVKGQVSFDFTKGWLATARGRYQSAIIRTYTSMTSYVGCDLKLEKAFKRFSVFLEGRDIFDQNITVETYSDDGNAYRQEILSYDRRLILLGLSVNF